MSLAKLSRLYVSKLTSFSSPRLDDSKLVSVNNNDEILYLYYMKLRLIFNFSFDHVYSLGQKY